MHSFAAKADRRGIDHESRLVSAGFVYESHLNCIDLSGTASNKHSASHLERGSPGRNPEGTREIGAGSQGKHSQPGIVNKWTSRLIQVAIENLVQCSITTDSDHAVLTASQCIPRYLDSLSRTAGDVALIAKTQSGEITAKGVPELKRATAR